MTPDQRARASADMTSAFIANYYQDWRLAKILSIKKILLHRYEFFSDFISEIKHPNDPHGDATIAQELKNALHFDAISHCVQYVEDLFALIYAAQQPEYFIKNIISYNAGRVTNLIKSFSREIVRSEITKAFHVPMGINFGEEHTRVYETQLQYLSDLVSSVAKFHKNYEFFHNQYKHGLTVAMRPFGNVYNIEQIAKDKADDFPAYIKAYDNFNLETAEKRGTFQTANGAFILGFTEHVRPFLADLANEDNILRLVHTPDLDIDIHFLTDVAYKVRVCINIFLHNYYNKIRPTEDKIKFALPVDYLLNRTVVITVEDS